MIAFVFLADSISPLDFLGLSRDIRMLHFTDSIFLPSRNN